jgi:hypothetical protein
MVYFYYTEVYNVLEDFFLLFWNTEAPERSLNQ